MDLHDLTRELHVKNDTKIVMLVADGLGGLPMQAGGKTELESASTPHLDALAARGVQGGSIPVAPGITPPRHPPPPPPGGAAGARGRGGAPAGGEHAPCGEAATGPHRGRPGLRGPGEG